MEVFAEALRLVVPRAAANHAVVFLRGNRQRVLHQLLSGALIVEALHSLIEHPFRMTHGATAESEFAAPRNLVRLSVGIESAGDLIADLEYALAPLG